MTATYTFDVFSSLDGFGSVNEQSTYGGYWDKQGPELLEHRRRSFDGEHRMVLGATTYRGFAAMLAASSEGTDPVFAGFEDVDLELLETHTLDGRTTELVYRPTLH